VKAVDVNAVKDIESKVEQIVKQVVEDPTELFFSEKSELESIIRWFLVVFAKDNMDVASTMKIFHEIDTGGSRPIRQHSRRIPFGEYREEASKQVKNLLQQGLIRESNSPLAQLIVMIKKKDGTWRMCVD
jgi:hypothetical protein